MNESVATLHEIADEIEDCAKRDFGIGTFLFHVSRLDNCLESVLFALNRSHDPASKRNEIFIDRLKRLPKSLAGYRKILKGPYDRRGRFRFLAAVRRIEKQISVMVSEAN